MLKFTYVNPTTKAEEVLVVNPSQPLLASLKQGGFERNVVLSSHFEWLKGYNIKAKVEVLS